jgi:hypothetical protein
MPVPALRAVRSPRATRSTRRVPSPLHPLDLAYTRAGLEPPAATVVLRKARLPVVLGVLRACDCFMVCLRSLKLWLRPRGGV